MPQVAFLLEKVAKLDMDHVSFPILHTSQYALWVIILWILMQKNVQDI